MVGKWSSFLWYTSTQLNLICIRMDFKRFLEVWMSKIGFLCYQSFHAIKDFLTFCCPITFTFSEVREYKGANRCDICAHYPCNSLPYLWSFFIAFLAFGVYIFITASNFSMVVLTHFLLIRYPKYSSLYHSRNGFLYHMLLVLLLPIW
jgi:hypothetical protein